MKPIVLVILGGAILLWLFSSSDASDKGTKAAVQNTASRPLLQQVSRH